MNLDVKINSNIDAIDAVSQGGRLFYKRNEKGEITDMQVVDGSLSFRNVIRSIQLYLDGYSGGTLAMFTLNAISKLFSSTIDSCIQYVRTYGQKGFSTDPVAYLKSAGQAIHQSFQARYAGTGKVVFVDKVFDHIDRKISALATAIWARTEVRQQQTSTPAQEKVRENPFPEGVNSQNAHKFSDQGHFQRTNSDRYQEPARSFEGYKPYQNYSFEDFAREYMGSEFPREGEQAKSQNFRYETGPTPSFKPREKKRKAPKPDSSFRPNPQEAPKEAPKPKPAPEQAPAPEVDLGNLRKEVVEAFKDYLDGKTDPTDAELRRARKFWLRDNSADKVFRDKDWIEDDKELRDKMFKDQSNVVRDMEIKLDKLGINP